MHTTKLCRAPFPLFIFSLYFPGKQTTMLDPATNQAENNLYFDPNYTISERKTSQNHGGQKSGESTPPLWRMSPQRRINYRSLSPESKARAVERGQRELMDMVRTMPDGCFELSLRDLVEKPCPDHHHHHHCQYQVHQNSETVMKNRSETCTGNGSNSSQVSTKICGNRNQDDDWWKRKIPILEDTNGATSTSKNSTTRHGRRSILPSLCFFIRPKKSEHPQHKNRLQEL